MPRTLQPSLIPMSRFRSAHVQASSPLAWQKRKSVSWRSILRCYQTTIAVTQTDQASKPNAAHFHQFDALLLETKSAAPAEFVPPSHSRTLSVTLRVCVVTLVCIFACHTY
ncbi:hypothetical protein J3459_008474 [Metarhizium acridum]|nr:hypothetical protein J3459_008474 [Metarhizium acridum]